MRGSGLISELNMLGFITPGRLARPLRPEKEMWFDATTSKIEEVVTRDPRRTTPGSSSSMSTV
jgi:cell division control protein 6